MKKRAFLFTLIVAVLLPFSVLAAQVGTFTSVNGRVDIAGADQVARLVKVGDPVDEGDVVRTKSNSRAEITFTDDNILRMAEKSRVVISEYVSSPESLTAKLSLSRGKVQNIVRKTGRIFGRLKKNRFEVHTPTAVVGVRGTNFFTYFQHGVSGAVFKEGEGYGYNPRMPDQVQFVTAGQALLITSTDAVPVTRDASDPDMDRHIQDTAPQGDEGGDDEGDGGRQTATDGDGNADLVELKDVVVDPRPLVKKVVEQILNQQVVADTLPTEVKIYIVNNVPFTAVLTTKPDAVTNSDTADFVIRAVGGTAAVYAYKFDDIDGTLSWFTTTDPAVQIANLNEGPHQIEFAAVDANGNRTTVSTYRWETDYTPPEVTLSNTPAALTNASSGTIGVSSSEAVTYTYDLDGNAVADSNLTGLSEGPHTLIVSATDAAGNTGTATHTWTTDYTAPDVILSNTPAADTNANASNIGVSSNETVTYTYDLDGNAVGSSNLTGLSEGPHTLIVSATDAAGNTGTATHTWTTDYTDPGVAITAKSATPGSTDGSDVSVSLASAPDAVSFSWGLTTGTQTGTGSTVNLADLPDGQHTLDYSATDAAGNTSTGSLTIDLYRLYHSGLATGTGSVLAGSASGSLSAVKGESWGGWQTSASGTYTGSHSGSWDLLSAGVLRMYSNENIEGYFTETSTGTGSSGTSRFEYLTLHSLGLGTGTASALFDYPSTGAWQITSGGSGVLTDTPLAYSASLGGKLKKLANGTLYSGDWERWDPSGGPDGTGGVDASYWSDYFLTQADGSLWYGGYHQNEEGGIVDTGYMYLPDGLKLDTAGEFVTADPAEWTPGSLTAADFNDPAAFTNWVNGTGKTWNRTWYEARSSNLLLENGVFSGMLGGIDDLWNSSGATPVDLIIKGDYQSTDGNYTEAQLLYGRLDSSGISDGAFSGFIRAAIDVDDAAGSLVAIGIDPSGSAGLVQGEFTGIGTVYPGQERWDSTGAISYTDMVVATGLTPADLSANLEYGLLGSWLAGDFGSSDSLLRSDLGWGETMSLAGYDGWGIFQFNSGRGNFAFNPDSSGLWNATLSGMAGFGFHDSSSGTRVADTGYWQATTTSGELDSPAAGMLAGQYTGEFLTLTKAGGLAGSITGSYDGTAGIWQAVSNGYWSNSQVLAFNGVTGHGDIVRTVDRITGSYDDGSGLSYNFEVERGVERGWANETDSVNNTFTSINYYPDGTTSSWTENLTSGAVTFSSGTYSGTVLDNLSNYTPPGGSAITVTSDSITTLSLDRDGHISAFMGSFDNLWAATAATPAVTRFMGEFGVHDEGIALPAVFSTHIKSINPFHGNNTIWDQADPNNPDEGDGGYYGRVSGLVLADDSLAAVMQGLYVDANGGVGIVNGSLAGMVDPRAELWNADGTLYPIELIPASGYVPSQLQPNDQGGIVREIYEDGEVMDSYSSLGWFMDYTTTPTMGSDIGWNSFQYTHYTVAGGEASWAVGIRSSLYGGWYDASTRSDYWFRPFEVADPTGMYTVRGAYFSMPNPDSFSGSEIGSVDTGGQWSSGLISGKGAAAWVDLDMVMTGVAGADLKGTFDPSVTTWQAAAAWAGMDTATYLTMAATEAGREKLGRLNIPCIEVGRTSLAWSGNDGVFTNVYVNDTTFFAYSTGAAPTLWGSGDAGGAYVSSPTQGHTVTLTGAEGLSANFKVNNWGTATWDASVSGGGTYSTTAGTDSMQGATVSFDGFAAGTHAGGTFSGTASGTVVPGG